MTTPGMPRRIDRRRFLQSAAGAGAALAYTPTIANVASAAEEPDPINVAVLGAGSQGRLLAMTARRISGVRFKAVCDIWGAYNLKWLSRLLKAYRHPVNAYLDYEEMLAGENALDAVIVATPDCWHARHTIACLEAGLHVYCETPMSNNVEDARAMLRTARRTGKLLQIGQQRRSNPRYRFCCDRLLHEVKLFGQLVAAAGQWNRAVQTPFGWPKGREVDEAVLKKHGYPSMNHHRNWRWYRGLGSGPVVALGSHQIDVYNWFLDARPTSVLASGRTNYHDEQTHEWCDTVMAVYEYETTEGGVTARYETLTANSHEGYFEKFMGEKGTLVLSERSDVGRLYPEPAIRREDVIKWAVELKAGRLTAPKAAMEMIERMTVEQLAQVLFIAPTPDPIVTGVSQAPSATVMSCGLAATLNKPHHQPHLENFFDAIRGEAKLNCPAEVGYETTVTVLKINKAIEAGRKLSFRPEDFVV